MFASAVGLCHCFYLVTIGVTFHFLLYFSMNNRLRFLGEIETDNLTVSNSEIITLDFTVSKNRIFVK